MLTDPIADMLTRIRNANRAMHDTASMPTSRMGGTQIAPGGIVEKPSPLDISNVMLVCPVCRQPTRVGVQTKEIKGETVRVRVCKRDNCGQEID